MFIATSTEMKFVYKQKTQKGGLYIPRNRDIFRDGLVQTGGMYHVNIGLVEELNRLSTDKARSLTQRGGFLRGNGNSMLTQSMKTMRENMRKKQRGGLGGFGNLGISQPLASTREKMRKKQRGGQKGGSRAGGMGMFGYKHKRGTGWKPKKSKLAKKVTDYVRDVLQLEMMEQQKAKAEAKGEKYNPFKTY